MCVVDQFARPQFVQAIKNRIDWLYGGRLKETSSCDLCNRLFSGNVMLEDQLTFLGVDRSLKFKELKHDLAKEKMSWT